MHKTRYTCPKCKSHDIYVGWSLIGCMACGFMEDLPAIGWKAKEPVIAYQENPPQPKQPCNH